jgi:sigma-E factor negative regulatory protein RseC
MTARVHAVSGGVITIEPGENTGCFGCMNQDCKNRLSLFTAENPQNLPLAPGQLVEAANSPALLLRQGLLALLPPLIGFIAGFFLTGLFFPVAGEGAKAAGGAFLLFAAGAGCYLLQRRSPPGQTVYRITRIIG